MAKVSREEADRRLKAVIDAFAETAYGSESDEELAASRALSIDRYLGSNISPAPVGRSQVRDRTTFEVVEWTKPSLLRIFTGGSQVAKFDPVGPGDEALAEQETDYVNHVILNRNNWHQICNDFAHDGLISKNGYAYAYWEDAVVPETESYVDLTDDAFALIAGDKEVEIVAHTQRPNEDLNERNNKQYQQALQQYQQQMQQMQMQQLQQGPQPPQGGAQMGGQPPQGGPQPPQGVGQPPPPPPPQKPQPAFLHDVDLKRTRKKGQVKICTLAPENCLIDVNTPDHTLEGANYFEWFDFKTLGDLRASGLDVPDDIADSGEELRDGPEYLSRNLYSENTLRDSDNEPDPALRRVRVRHIWVKFDYDGDGLNELQYVILVGDTVLYRKECEEIPVASWSPIPMSHRHVGMSLADSVADIEDISTNITRQAIDNLNLANTPRIAVSDRVNMADLLDVRVGGVIRVDGQPPQEFMPVEVPNIFQNAVQALSFFDSRRQNRTGINAYFQGTDANALNKTASGISQLTNSAAQRVEMIGRHMAEGVRRLFLIVHRLILQHGHSEEVYRLRDRWVTIDPSQWRKRTDVTLTVGLGTGNKDSLLAQLNQMFQMQMAAAQFGVVDPPNIYETLSEVAKAASFANPERFASDPRTKPPPQPQTPLEIQVEQIRLQGNMQEAQMKGQSEQQRVQMQMQADAQRIQSDAQTKAQLEQMRLAFEKWKTEFEAQVEIQIEQMRLGGSSDLELRKIASTEAMKSAELERDDEDMAERKALEALMQQVEALKQGIVQVVQKVDGSKVIGVEKVRDPKTGRMVAGRIKRADGTEEEITLQ